MEGIIGRTKVQSDLEKLFKSGKSELLIVYGRRRVGKTHLIRKYFEGRFTFYTTGMYEASQEQQLEQFATTLSEYQKTKLATPHTWIEAFAMLKAYLLKSRMRRKVVFFDEIPWYDTPNSGFLPAFEAFWNGWGAGRDDLLLIVCGSATTWITNKLLSNKGGLFNRATSQIYLEPFTLHETEQFLKSKGINWSRYDITECYMVMGGIPYYLQQLDPRKSYMDNIDEMFFRKNCKLKDEFRHLYNTLFSNSEYYIRIVELLSSKNIGLTREELVKMGKFRNNGYLTEALRNLETSDFVRAYNYYGKKKKNITYQLCDFYSMFYFRFIRQQYGRDEHFWSHSIDLPQRRAWAGYMFEQVCYWHIPQIKQSLGISGILSEQSAWYEHKADEALTSRGAQIDMIIARRDRIISLCEMKFSIGRFVIDSDYEMSLRDKLTAFRSHTLKSNALQIVMISTFGVKPNVHSGIVQSEVLMDDLYEEI